jgi:ubiquinone/menaquinone biosynthesis C-methylase UbiE
MLKDRSFWPEWARFLQHSGLVEIVAALMQSAGPLNRLLAQVLYAGRPFLGQAVSEEQFDALVHIFEDQEESSSFAAYIREETSR